MAKCVSCGEKAGFGYDECPSCYEKRVKVAEAEAEQKAQEANNAINEKVVTKTQVIKQKADIVMQYIDREVVKYDQTCVIPKEFIKAINDSAESPK